MELLLDRELVITEDRLERIHQAVMFYADRVSLRATSEIRGGDPFLETRLRQLREIGAVRTWAHEYEVDDGGRIRGGTWSAVFTDPVDEVLALEHMRELVRQVDDELDITHVPHSGTLREGVAEVVQFRRSVIGLRIADSLAADGLLTGGRRGSSLTAGVTRLTEPADDYQAVVRTIVGLCTFDRLRDLPLKALVQCRRHMPAFRRHLHDKIGSSGGSDPQRLAHDIVAEYQNLLERYAKGHEIRDLAADAGWDVIGVFLPPAVLVKYLGKPLAWFRRRRDFGPFVLLSELRAHQRRA